jgi:ubiquinone/menaquinone biosynthesis C-methylase UbiE
MNRSHAAQKVDDSDRTAQSEDRVRKALLSHYIGVANSLSPAELQKELQDHLSGRLNHARERFVPWLKGLVDLSRSECLEIGSGTGSATLAMLESGCKVVGVDIHPGSLEVARIRAVDFEQSVEFHVLNASHLAKVTGNRAFDLAVFYSSLEHMTVRERLAAIKKSWQALRPGGWLVVADTPNRLWFKDDHTTGLPFMHWLPDDLAFQYSKRSSKASLRRDDAQPSHGALAKFLRHGRGVSFHEFELALELNVNQLSLSSMTLLDVHFQEIGQNTFSAKDARAAFLQILKSAEPSMDVSFLQPSLNLAIQKPSDLLKPA